MLFLTIPLALTLSSVAQALLVVPTSPQCADLCGNTLDSTSGYEISCSDSAYAGSTYGADFESCVSCEIASTYYDNTTQTSDLQWALYNLRYALSWCLFGFDNNTQVADTPCLTSLSCGPLQSAFEYDSLDQNASLYGYCPFMNSVSVPKCSQCLAELGNEHYLSNFVTALEAACVQQPADGATISIQGSLFSSTSVNITTPSATPISTYTASTGGFTLGAKIGIVVAGIVVILVISGCCIIWRGKRRRRRVLAEKAKANGYEWQPKHGATSNSPKEQSGGYFDSPQSQRPFANAWGHDDNSPASAVEKAYFSPYSSQYTSPVSAHDRLVQAQEWPRDNKQAFSPDGPSHVPDWQVDSKRGFPGLGMEEEAGERIEMTGINNPSDARSWNQHVAPVLSHPGPGRGVTGLAEDVKNGHGL